MKQTRQQQRAKQYDVDTQSVVREMYDMEYRARAKQALREQLAAMEKRFWN